MSGGSYDYVCFKISEIEIRGINANPRRAAFQKLLNLVGEAMHDIEWVDSCDYGEGDENEAIDKCFAMLKSKPELIAKANAYDKLIDNLKKWIAFN